VIDFPGFKQQFLATFSMISGVIEPMPLGNRFILFWTYYMPYATGWVLAFFNFVGILYFPLRQFLKRESFLTVPALIYVSTVILYFATAFPKSQMVRYTMPMIPLLSIFSAQIIVDGLRLKAKTLKFFSVGMLLGVIGYTFVYTEAYLKLYQSKNVRVLASAWIEKNIPAGSAIAIARSYYWTPPILRQYHPPYRLEEGCDDQSPLNEGVLNLEKILKKSARGGFEARISAFPTSCTP
jgi:hypothetical protein